MRSLRDLSLVGSVGIDRLIERALSLIHTPPSSLSFSLILLKNRANFRHLIRRQIELIPPPSVRVLLRLLILWSLCWILSARLLRGRDGKQNNEKHRDCRRHPFRE